MSTPSTATVDHEMLELRWRHWPLRAYWPWSLLVPLGIVAAGIVVSVVCGQAVPGVLAGLVLVWSLVRFLLPQEYIAHSGGFQRLWFGRVGAERIRSWQALRAYQLRATGLALFDRFPRVPLHVLRGQFLPYGNDPDELLCAIREFAPHAEELPPS